jgi:hypothetical protein
MPPEPAREWGYRLTRRSSVLRAGDLPESCVRTGGGRAPMRYSHEKRLKTVGLGPASSNPLVRFLCGCLSRASLFEVTALVPEPCPTVSGGANGGTASAGLGEDDDVLGAAAEPADAIPLFSGLEWSDRPPSDRSAPSGNPSMVLVAPSDAPGATIPTESGGLATLVWASTGRSGFLSLKASDENGVIVINLSS